jgi:hypothetical protein
LVLFSWRTEVYINQTFDLIFTDAIQRAEKKAETVLDQCHQSLSTMIEENPLEAVDALSDCMSQKINETLAFEEDERNFQSHLRTTMAQQMTSYACGDPDYETSTETLNRTWHYEVNPGEYREFLMKTYHERPTSRIMTVPDFVGETECQALKASTKSGIFVPFVTVNGQNRESIILHAFASKMYEFMRVTLSWSELDFGDQYHLGQELFDVFEDRKGLEVPEGKCKKESTSTEEASIDSDGQVVTTEAEEETEESDKGKTCRMPGAAPIAASTKRFEASGIDVATLFIFCDEPKSLGGIHFPLSGVHINPEKGTAVVAVHRFRDDPGFDGYAQEYHMCPNYHVYKHKFMQNK